MERQHSCDLAVLEFRLINKTCATQTSALPAKTHM